MIMALGTAAPMDLSQLVQWPEKGCEKDVCWRRRGKKAEWLSKKRLLHILNGSVGISSPVSGHTYWNLHKKGWVRLPACCPRVRRSFCYCLD